MRCSANGTRGFGQEPVGFQKMVWWMLGTPANAAVTNLWWRGTAIESEECLGWCCLTGRPTSEPARSTGLELCSLTSPDKILCRSPTVVQFLGPKAQVIGAGTLGRIWFQPAWGWARLSTSYSISWLTGCKSFVLVLFWGRLRDSSTLLAWSCGAGRG